jgi:hypothetical protein
MVCPGQRVLKVSHDIWEGQAAGAFGHGQADEQSPGRHVHRRVVERQPRDGYTVGSP